MPRQMKAAILYETNQPLVIDAAEAVAHAHARLILHRDLKPSNMLVRADGQLKLLDFGIAKLLDEPGRGDAGELTRAAGAAFTPTYAAPEQLQGGEVTTATGSASVILEPDDPCLDRIEALSSRRVLQPRAGPRHEHGRAHRMPSRFLSRRETR